MLSHFIPSIITTSFDAFGAIGPGGGTGVTENVSLAGTSSVPQNFFGAFPVYDSGTWYVENGFYFSSNGNIYKYTYNNGSSQVFTTAQWNNTTPSQTYYVRFTNDGGSFGINVGNSLNTWHALNTSRYFGYFGTETFGSYGNVDIQAKVEIATDSGGSNIIATGYYQCIWEGGA